MQTSAIDTGCSLVGRLISQQTVSPMSRHERPRLSSGSKHEICTCCSAGCRDQSTPVGYGMDPALSYPPHTAPPPAARPVPPPFPSIHLEGLTRRVSGLQERVTTTSGRGESGSSVGRGDSGGGSGSASATSSSRPRDLQAVFERSREQQVAAGGAADYSALQARLKG